MINALAGCASDAQQPVQQSVLNATFTPFQPLPEGVQPTFDGQENETPAPEAVLTPELSPTPIPIEAEKLEKTIWIDQDLPGFFHTEGSIPPEWQLAEKAEASLHIAFGDGQALSQWFFVLVAPFPTVSDNFTASDLRSLWAGSPPAPLSFQKLQMSAMTRDALEALWGPPGETTVKVRLQEQLLEKAWNDPNIWTIVPFENLEPRWKVIAIDGLSPIHNDFNELDYALRIPISIQGDTDLIKAFLQESRDNGADPFPNGNRDADKLTVLAMTGVTALVRATAHTMETIGVKYPGEAIRDWLYNADLTHISNEVPFAENCPFPNPNQGNLMFCSDPRYIELLEYVGTDIVELTGDHFADWGTSAMYYTLELYQELGWATYGGGVNLSEGKKPITLEHNGNRLAFIGCNGKGGEFASASSDTPGSVVCDFPYMQQEIKRLRSEGYLVIASFQHYEYYTYLAQPYQLRDFRLLADAGALIVSGSQAHQPQGMEFYNNAFLHYGLGNLFFDQYLLGYPMRQGFIDRHVFYDNRYLSTELLTILFIDFAQPRPMTEIERSDLLQSVFAASGW